MSCSTKPVLNALYTPNVCLISLPTNFNPKILNPYLSIPSKLIKLHTSYSLSPPLLSFSLKNNARSSTVLPFVAQTSEWAQQEEENPVIGGEEQGFSWGGEVEDDEGAVEAIGDAGESSEEGETYPEPPEDAKIFVGNLAYDVDSERLAQLFEQGGVVEIAEVIYNRATDQSRGFGFVTMSTVEEADKAVDMFHQYELNGRLLTVNKAAPRGSRTESPPRVFEPAYRMYVGNLPWSVDNARLEQVFREHGKVVDARVLYDRDTGRSRGFGFVTMSTEEELNDAIAKLDGQNLDGRTIKVNVAEERPRRSF